MARKNVPIVLILFSGTFWRNARFICKRPQNETGYSAIKNAQSDFTGTL
jgi:hypothetical protein